MPSLVSLSSSPLFAFAASAFASAVAAVAAAVAAAAAAAAAASRCSRVSLCLLIAEDLSPSVTLLPPSVAFLQLLVALGELSLGTCPTILEAFKFKSAA
jgi:hypothetical protein